MAQSTAGRVAIVDIATEKVVDAIGLPQNPSGLALSPDSQKLYATGDGPKGKLFVYDLKKKKMIDSLVLGHTPMSPVIDGDEAFLYTGVRFNNKVVVVDLKKKKVVAEISVAREPVALGLSKDGTALFVANHLPAGVANTSNIAAQVDVIDTASEKVVTSIVLPNGSSSLRGLCVSPDGRYVYVTHLLSRYTMPTTQLERGWMNTNALSIIDAKKMEPVNTVLLDDLTEGAANPWAVACSPDGKTLCVTHAGTHEVSLIDRQGLHHKLDKITAGEYTADTSLTPEKVPDTLSLLGPLRQRLTLGVKGPRGCAIAGTRLFVTGYFSEAVEMIDLEAGYGTGGKVIALGSAPTMSEVRRGEFLFNDAADMCFQKWQSCASCHPDARADGLNWDLMNDGMGNPKSTKSMLYAHRTPPVMISGIRDKAETAVRSGMKFIQMVKRPESDAIAMDAYLKSLKPVESPYLEKGKLGASARRGKTIFAKAGCAACHSGKLFTDLKSYDVGTGQGIDQGKPFDTPTLVEAWRNGPFLVDGRAATVEEVLTQHNPRDQHGNTTRLTSQEIKELADYVLSQ